MTTNWPFPNRMLPNGTWECGTRDAAIWFKPDGLVSLRRGSRSLKADWISTGSRYGALDKSIKRLSTEEEPLYDSEGNRVSEFGAQLDPIVFELASRPADLNLPNVLMALAEIMAETTGHKFKLKRDKFMQQMNAAWAIQHRISVHKNFLDELKRLCRELGHPPTRGHLGGVLKISTSRMTRLCQELCFDWLPTKRSGPHLRKKLTR